MTKKCYPSPKFISKFTPEKSPKPKGNRIVGSLAIIFQGELFIFGEGKLTWPTNHKKSEDHGLIYIYIILGLLLQCFQKVHSNILPNSFSVLKVRGRSPPEQAGSGQLPLLPQGPGWGPMQGCRRHERPLSKIPQQVSWKPALSWLSGTKTLGSRDLGLHVCEISRAGWCLGL